MSSLCRRGITTLTSMSPTSSAPSTLTDIKDVDMRIEEDGVAVVTFQSPGPVNVLNKKVYSELNACLKEANSRDDIRAIVLTSNKHDCFIAGTDVNMLGQLNSANDFVELSNCAQKTMEVLSDGKPVVAAISGACLGGGLEVATACHFRIMSGDVHSVVGVPEVKLGLLPGGGGTQLLPRLVGIPTALKLLLTGNSLNASKAKKSGLIDMLVDPLGPGVASAQQNTFELLLKISIQVARDIDNKIMAVPNRDRIRWSISGIVSYLLTDTKFGREQALKFATRDVLKKTLGNYPAAMEIIEVVREGMNKGIHAGLAREAKSFGLLGTTDVSKNLLSLHIAETFLKTNRNGKPTHEPRNVAVIGAGFMGAGVAQVSLNGNFSNVIMKDISTNELMRGRAQIEDTLSRKVARKAMSSLDKDVALSKLTTSLDYDDLAKADLVIEAVFEDLKVKHAVLQAAQAVAPDHCVFASNTSSLPISDIAKGSSRPSQVVGMHYFSPVDKMQLLEVIVTKETSKEAAAVAVEAGVKQGKSVIVVNDGPGFYTTRILGPLLLETVTLMLEGVDIHRLDHVMKRFGFPVGPVTLHDEVGIDIASYVSNYLGGKFSDHMDGNAVKIYKDLVSIGSLGRKSSEGFFLYNSKTRGARPINPKAEKIIKSMKSSIESSNMADEDLVLRMTGRLVNEAVLCLQENILYNPTDGDYGAVYGLGFPPNLGGPFRWIDNYGAAKFVDKLRAFSDHTGSSHYKPARLLLDHVKAGTKFHK